MNLIKYFIVALLLVLPAFHTHAADKDPIVGTWAEYRPKDNVVQFEKGGAWKIYLKKGEIGDLHFLDGKWEITSDGKLKITLKMGGETKSFSSKLKFDGEELVLTDDDGSETRHRKHKGPLPERFKW